MDARKSDRERKRIINSGKNMVTSATFQIVLGIVAFIERTVFLSCLSPDYLGLNTLFSNVLYVLSIAELGIGSTISYLLYKPLATDDTHTIAVYMNFFCKAYYVIGSIIILVGLAISPLVSIFLNSENEVENTSFYFIIYLFAVGLTYFFSYKQILIEADQKKYINQTVICLGSIAQSGIQIVVLMLTRSYMLYICVFLAVNIIKNIILSIIADRMYPYIRRRRQKNLRLQKEDRRKIVSNIRAMCYYKFGEVAIGSSDSIIISALVDLRSLGLYANYQIITESVLSSMRVFYSSVMASIGNLCVTEDNEKIYDSFNALNFANFILSSFLAVVMFNLVQPIISIWLGSNYLFNMFTVFLITMVFYLNVTRNMLVNYHNVCGLYWADKYLKIGEAVVNIVVSIALGRIMGLPGIFIGTISSHLFGFWIQGAVVYKYVFNRSPLIYVAQYLGRTVITIALMLITWAATILFRPDSLIISLLWHILCCMTIPVLFYFVIYRRNPHFILMKDGLKKIVHTFFDKRQ